VGIVSEKKLVKSTYTVAAFTMLSRILGFVRDIVLALTFGAGPAFDAFVIAFKIPNFMRRLFAEGAFSQAFVPVLAEYRQKKTPDEVRQFLSHIAGTLGLVLLLCVVLGELLAPWLIVMFAPGFTKDPMRFHDAAHMLHITFPYLLLIALTAFAGATLNTFNRFSVPAFTPVLLNVSLIAVAVWWAPQAAEPIYTLAWGVLLGGVAQLALQLPFLYRLKLLPCPRPAWRDVGVLRVMRLMVPALFGVSVAQISLLIDNFFASFLPTGSISWLYYSDRFTYLPQGVIGVALATVVLPTLSRHHSQGQQTAYRTTLDWALRAALLVGVPAMVGLIVLAGPLLTTLIRHGAFDNHDVLMTQQSLWAFSVGLPAFMWIKILASAFYSRQDIKTPVKIAAGALLVNVVFIFLLIKPLAHAGLALSTSLASFFNAALLFWCLKQRNIFVPRPGWGVLLLRFLVANIAMAWVLYRWVGPLSRWFVWGLWTQVWHLGVAVLLGMLTYVITLGCVGLRRVHLRQEHT
jgi:putative peptidoglycan lipid II flippase